MKKLFKYFAIAALVLVVLIAAAIIIVPRVVDPQDLVAQAATVVKEKTGRELKVGGEIEWDVFPWVELKLGDVSLSNPQGFSGAVFAAAERLEIRVKLLPLIEKKVEMDTVVVHGLAVNLERLEDGRSNWTDFTAEASGQAPTSTDSGQSSPSSTSGSTSSSTSGQAANDAPPIAALAIGGLDVRQAKIGFVDAQTGQRYQLSNLGLESGAVALGDPVDIKLGFDLQSAKPEVQGRIELGANVLAVPEAKTARFDRMVLTADVRGGAVPMSQLRATLTGDAKLDGEAMTAVFSAMNLAIDGKGAGQLPFDELKMALGGQLVADGVKQEFTFGEMKLTVEGSGAKGAGFKTLNATVNGDLAGSAETQSLKLSGLKIVADLKGHEGGAFETARTVAQANVSANGKAQSFKLENLTVNADLTGPNFPDGATKATATANVDFDGAKGNAEVSDFKIDLLGLKATGGLRGTDLNNGGQVKGRVVVSPFNPRRVAALFGQQLPATADAKVLSSLGVNTGITLTGNLGAGELRSIDLNPLAVKLDDSNLNGRFAVADLKRQALRFDLKVDRINADRYMPKAKVASGATGQASASNSKAQVRAPTPGAAAGAANILPVEQLRALDIDGRLAVGALKVNNLDVSKVAATVKAGKGVVSVSPVSAALYKGTYRGNIRIDARGKVPSISVDERVNGVDSDALLSAMQGKSSISGKADLSAKLKASGQSTGAMKRSLTGTTKFAFHNGALKGINIGRSIREAQARLTGRALPPSNEPLQTDFAVLSGSMKFVNGVGTNDDLSAQSPLLRISGKGSANLVSEAIDYRALVKIVGSVRGQGGKGLDELTGVPIPLRVGGTFSKPSYGLDFEGLAQAIAKSKAEALVKKKLKKKLGDGVAGQVLEKVLGGGEKTEGAKQGGGSVLDNLLGGDKKSDEGSGGGVLKKLFGN